jgi:hypothetical protein
MEVNDTSGLRASRDGERHGEQRSQRPGPGGEQQRKRERLPLRDRPGLLGRHWSAACRADDHSRAGPCARCRQPPDRGRLDGRERAMNDHRVD